MVSYNLRPYLYRLDEIEVQARRNFGCNTNLYLYHVTREFMRHWRYIQANHSDTIKYRLWDELYFFFNEKLFEIARCRLDMMWMIYEYDNEQLFHEDHQQGPFWRPYPE